MASLTGTGLTLLGVHLEGESLGFGAAMGLAFVFLGISALVTHDRHRRAARRRAAARAAEVAAAADRAARRRCATRGCPARGYIARPGAVDEFLCYSDFIAGVRHGWWEPATGDTEPFDQDAQQLIAEVQAFADSQHPRSA